MGENRNSPARIRANNKYNAKAYDRINIAVPKGKKTAIENHVKGQGETVNSFVNRLIRADMGLTETEWKQEKEEN